MTVMERQTKSSTTQKALKNGAMTAAASATPAGINSQEERRSSLTSAATAAAVAAAVAVTGSMNPRKGSIGYDVVPQTPPSTTNSNGGSVVKIPNTSNLSLSSTTSTNSSSTAGGGIGSVRPPQLKYVYGAAAAAAATAVKASSPMSRRQSGNSITIKVTNVNNADFEINDETTRPYDEDDPLDGIDPSAGAAGVRTSPAATTASGRRAVVDSIDLDDNSDREDNLEADDEDRDGELEREGGGEGEGDDNETTTNSAAVGGGGDSTSSPPRRNRSKKSRDKKKFVRSHAQQKHHLVYQESEDLVDEQQQQPRPHPPRHRLPNLPTNMNSAFDELFAAAEEGDSSKSAMIEAKMAAEAAQLAAELEPTSTAVPSSPKYSNADEEAMKRSHNRSASMRVSRPRAFSRLLHHRDPNLDPTVIYSGNNAGAADDEYDDAATTTTADHHAHLGSPQQLTRSVSCKRPGSFKKMRSKNASPNQTSRGVVVANAAAVGTAPNPSHSPGSGDSKRSNSPRTGQRRGTQCSITLMDDFDPSRQQQSQNRAGSLPFENLIRPQTLSIPATAAESGESPVDTTAAPTEVYRVRQFVSSSKGAVINRGDSFKRSFKRSNQSLSSSGGTGTGNGSMSAKKGGSDTPTTTTTGNHQQHLSLPSAEDDGNVNGGGGLALKPLPLTDNLTTTPMSAVVIEQTALRMGLLETPPPPLPDKTYVVYVLGAPTVGKNALIKQFKTSEYRGTYDICPHQSTDEEPEEGVSILLDGIESKLQFTAIDVDMIKPNSVFEITKDNDAFIVVYSISDKSSYHTAIDLLKSMRNASSENKTKPVILVGNKSDLVRKRAISREDGGMIAFKYGCKFVETSVAINDKVDDLLAGILKQIRLRESFDRDATEQETSFTVASAISGGGGNTVTAAKRNYSDAQLHDLTKSKKPTATLLSFKSNTLSRKFFKSKSNRDAATMTATTSSNNVVESSRLGNKATTHISFFHKIYNTIFRRKAHSVTHLQSVENLFSLPPQNTPALNRMNAATNKKEQHHHNH